MNLLSIEDLFTVQILDTADPLYKYKDGKNLKKRRKNPSKVGTSYCTWEDATLFAEKWNKTNNYSLLFKNCQHFTEGLTEYLTEAACNNPRFNESDIVKREDMEAELEENIEPVLASGRC